MGVRRLAVANGPNIFQMLLVMKSDDEYVLQNATFYICNNCFCSADREAFLSVCLSECTFHGSVQYLSYVQTITIIGIRVQISEAL